MSGKEKNRVIKAQNGNRTLKQVIKVFHWNIGPGWWENKIVEVEGLIEENHPDLLFISEANLRNEISDEIKSLEGYNLILPMTAENHGYSRLILLIREEIDYKVMESFMSNEGIVIWVKVAARGRRPIYIGGAYREHQLLLQPQPNNTGTPRLQQRRWGKIIDGWKLAAKNVRCIMIGDLNLDYMKWQQPDPGHTRMIDKTKDRD